MEKPLAYLKQRINDDWLIDDDTQQLNTLTEELFQQLTQFSKGRIPPKILIAEQNPLRFLAAFLAAVAANCPVFLCNPNWVQQEWQQVFELVQPDLIFGQGAENLPITDYRLPITQSHHDSHRGFLRKNPLCRSHLGNVNGISGGISPIFWQQSGEFILCLAVISCQRIDAIFAFLDYRRAVSY